MNRYLIFFHFNQKNHLSNYVSYGLSKISFLFKKIIFVSNSSLTQESLDKISLYSSKIIVRENKGYDFGGWFDAIQSEGWLELEKYDSLTLMNDTCFFPLYNMESIYSSMEKKINIDFWGNTIHPQSTNDTLSKKENFPEHVQSYFLVFNNNVIKSQAFKNFWNNIIYYDDVSSVIQNYETQITKKISESGFMYSSWIHNHNQIFCPNIAHHCPNLMLDQSSPFIKIKNFIDISHDPLKIKKRIALHTKYPTFLIDQHLKNTYGVTLNTRYCFFLKLKKYIRALYRLFFRLVNYTLRK